MTTEAMCLFCRQFVELDKEGRFIIHTMGFPVVVYVGSQKVVGERRCDGSGMTIKEELDQLR